MNGAAWYRALNGKLQATVNPPGESRVERFGWTYGPDDKVMQVADNYERDMFNGDLGVFSDRHGGGRAQRHVRWTRGDLRLRRTGRAGVGLHRHNPQEAGVEVSGRGEFAHDSTSACWRVAYSTLGDPGQATGGAGETTAGAGHRGAQSRRSTPMV